MQFRLVRARLKSMNATLGHFESEWSENELVPIVLKRVGFVSVVM